ncbi:MAG: PEP/pyruvate-binding domain-containing protein [Myxococcota bacterium]
MKFKSMLVAFGLAAACSAGTGSSGDEAEVDRGPLGKADAAGSCRGDDGETFCGGKSAGACWCDDQCVDFGDCCSDIAPVCEADLALAEAALATADQFDQMAFTGAGSVVIGKSVKFVIDNRDAASPTLRYLNANFDGPVADERATQFHYFFSREVFEIPESTAEFNDVTYNVNDKRYFAGTLQQYTLGDDDKVLYGIQFYPQDVIAEQTVLKAVQEVAASFRIPDARLAFVATGQQQTTETVAAAITAEGVENLTLDEVLGELDYLPMQLGEAWGFLRIFPENQDLLSALDIPVFDELPLDLTVVAATVTRAVQDASSHINLKSKERGTPNMVLRSAAKDHEVLAQFDGKPVHLTVGPDGFQVELSTEEIVREKLAEKLDKPWRAIGVDPTAEMITYDAMCPADERNCIGVADKWGGKAGGLGFLRSRDVLGRAHQTGTVSARLGYDIAPPGVAVPVQRYFDFVAANPDLEAKLAEFIALEKEGTLSVANRVERLDAIRADILAAKLPDGFAAEVEATVRAALPATSESAKIRSSANAEDIPGFDGAGLYESYRARFDEDTTEPCHVEIDPDDGDLRLRPRTFDCVIKGVYASLWNKRAVEERSFARIDHEFAGMGLAIVQRYREKDRIAANSVAITRVLNSSGVFGYTFGNQEGNNVVTNPQPGTQSENVIAGFIPGAPASFTVTRFAKPEPDVPVFTETVMTEEEMLEMLDITQAVELAYCRANPDYYPGDCNFVTLDIDKPTSLDMEFKFYENGDFLCKQVREFAGR